MDIAFNSGVERGTSGLNSAREVSVKTTCRPFRCGTFRLRSPQPSSLLANTKLGTVPPTPVFESFMRDCLTSSPQETSSLMNRAAYIRMFDRSFVLTGLWTGLLRMFADVYIGMFVAGGSPRPENEAWTGGTAHQPD